MSPQSRQLEVVTHVAESMGGTLEIAITAAPSDAPSRLRPRAAPQAD